MAPTWVWQILFGTFVTGGIAFFVSINKRLNQLEKDSDVAKFQLIPLWAHVQKVLSADVHHDDPKFKEPDDLIDKLQNLTITFPERTRLKELLSERVVDPAVTELESKKAKALIAIMDVVLIENETALSKIINTAITILFATSVHLSYMIKNYR